MADITKCPGYNCPLKESCYRFTARADPYWQYWMETPWKDETQECDHFLVDPYLKEKDDSQHKS